MTQAELDFVVSAHERFVAGKSGGKRAVLRFANLSGLDLSHRILTEADLSASVLDGCRMIRTRLERANLFGCDLRNSDMRQAILIRADLRGCCLRGSNLSQADLTYLEQFAAYDPPAGGGTPKVVADYSGITGKD